MPSPAVRTLPVLSLIHVTGFIAPPTFLRWSVLLAADNAVNGTPSCANGAYQNGMFDKNHKNAHRKLAISRSTPPAVYSWSLI